MSTTRDNTLDGIKFILICLVIIGHSLEPTRYTSNVTGWIYTPIYLVHMPLFVLISGYFSKDLTWDKIRRGAIKLIETYLLSSLIVFVFINRSLTEFLCPSQANWYLLALVFWRFMIYMSSKLDLTGGKLLIGSSAISLIAFTIPISNGLQYFAIERVLQFFPFFVIGYLLTESDVCNLRAYRYKYILYVATVLLCVIAGAFSCRGLHLIEFHRETVFSIVTDTGLNTSVVWLFKFLVELSAVILSIAFITVNALPSWICNLGKYSLQLYVIQILLIQYGIRLMPKNAIIEIMSAICCILVSLVVIKSGFGQWITNPISTIIKLKNEAK